MRYEMVLTGTHSDGTLNLNVSLFDLSGETPTLLGYRLAADTEPLSGEYFGLRHSTAHPSHGLDLGHHTFSVTAIPEPSVAALAGLGLLLCLRRWERARER